MFLRIFRIAAHIEYSISVLDDVFRLLGLSGDSKSAVVDVDLNVLFWDTQGFEGGGDYILLDIFMKIHPVKRKYESRLIFSNPSIHTLVLRIALPHRPHFVALA